MFEKRNNTATEARIRAEINGAKIQPVELAASIAFVTMAEAGAIDDVTASEHTELFTPWVEGVSYTVGELRSYDGALYRCAQAHTSQTDWTPDVTPALWVKVGDPADEWPEWSQPIGAHDAYNTGDQVTYQGQHYRSTVDGNVWVPGVYGWEAVA